MSFEVIPTETFGKELKDLSKKYPAIKKDITLLSVSLSDNPQQGTPLGKDCFKIRMKITGKSAGKRGGGRVITCIKIISERVYLLSIYDKADQSTSDELDNLLNGLSLEE